MSDRDVPVEVGLTGGIACGKSEVARIWKALGIPVLDTDEVAHEVMLPGTAAYQGIRETFGDEVVDTNGQINRTRLGAKVFESAELRHRLNGLVHPAVRSVWTDWRADRRAAGEPAVVAIPLLFEVGAETGWDAVVCVVATYENVLKRLGARGLSRDDADRRIAAQMPVAEKAKRSDVVIENNGNMDDLERAAMTAWHAIRTRGTHGSGAEFTREK